MEWIARERDRLAWVAGLVCPLAVAAALIPFRSSFASPAEALVLVAVVAAVAIVGNRPAGVLAALSAALWFDFFLTRPYERLTISHRSDIETAVSLLVVGLVVTEIAARNRRHRQWAVEEADYVALIYRIAEMTAKGSPPNAIINRANTAIFDLLHLRDCHFDARMSNRRVARVDSGGDVVHAGLRWAVHEVGLPGPEAEILVENRGRTLGRFVLVPTPGLAVSKERRIVALAVADQVGAALAPELRSA